MSLTYKPIATAISCREDDPDAMVMLGVYRELQSELTALRAHNAALIDTFKILRDYIEGRRHDTENITKIINGAIT
jgi:hypothetical protein